jgi:hypothetical protein
MNFNSTGGLMLVGAAALWLAVFIPGWVKRNEVRQIRRAKDMSSKVELKNARLLADVQGSAKTASRSARLATTRRLTGTLSVAATLGALGLALAAISTPVLWVTFAITATFALITATISLRAAQSQASLLETSAKSRGETAARLSYKLRVEAVAASFEAATQVDPRAWERRPLPDQLVPIGELQLPESAEVVDISSVAKAEQQSDFTSEELNEIMRRRRAVG